MTFNNKINGSATKLMNAIVEAVQMTPVYNDTTDKFLKVNIINSIREVLKDYDVSKAKVQKGV